MGEYIDKSEAVKIIGCGKSWFDMARSKKMQYPSETSEAVRNLTYKKVKNACSYKFLYLKSDIEKIAKEHPYKRRQGGLTKAYIAKRNNYINEALQRWREMTGHKNIAPYEAPEPDRQLHLNLLQVCLEE